MTCASVGIPIRSDGQCGKRVQRSRQNFVFHIWATVRTHKAPKSLNIPASSLASSNSTANHARQLFDCIVKYTTFE